MFDEDKISYKLRRGKNYKRIILKVKRNGDIEVSAPKRISLKYIDEFVSKNKKWVTEKRASMEDKAFCHNFEEGEIFYLEGNKYKLSIDSSLTEGIVRIEDDKIIVPKNDIEQTLERFYKNRTRVDVESFLRELKEKDLSLFSLCKRISFRKAESQWGSCSSLNNINFSTRLAMLPLSCVRYVVYHEFVHLKIKNHSSEFYKLLKYYLPDHKNEEKRIKFLSKTNNLSLK